MKDGGLGDRLMGMNQSTRQSGSALVLALICALLLTLVSFEVAHTTRIEAFINNNIEVDAKLDVACRAGLEKGLALLREDRQQTEIDSQNDTWFNLNIDSELVEADVAADEFMLDDNSWSEETNDTELMIQIFDESAKFNLYLLLVDDASESRRRRERLANVIDKFREDTDYDVSFPEGMEIADQIAELLKRTKDNPYNNLPKPVTKAERTISLTEEVLYVDGIDKSMMFDLTESEGERLVPGLFRFITVWSDLQTNINTADLAVLSGLFTPGDAFLAERIINYREQFAEDYESENFSDLNTSVDEDQEEDPTGGAPFSQISEMREKVDGITQETYNDIRNYLTVQSEVFSIFVTARRGLIRRTKMFIVRRNEQGFRILFEKLVDFPYLMDTEDVESASEAEADLKGF